VRDARHEGDAVVGARVVGGDDLAAGVARALGRGGDRDRRRRGVLGEERELADDQGVLDESCERAAGMVG